MAKELEKTLQVNGEEYNINAKTAEVAVQTQSSLIVNRSNLNPNTEPTKLVDFNGSAEKTILIVPADEGGRFNKRIAVPKYDRKTIDDESVLNFGDIRDIVVPKLINTSVLYTWNGSVLNPTLDENDSKICSISLVTGTEANIQADSEYNFAVVNNINNTLSSYLYICSDTGNLYFGTSNSMVAIRLAKNTDSANKLANSQHFSVSLDSSAEVDFDGTNDAALGVTGTLPVNKGGTGATNASTARTNLGITPANIGAAATGHTHNYAGSASPGGAADSALKATKDANGNIIASYYQKKITISSSAPSGGANGDIWIKY